MRAASRAEILPCSIEKPVQATAITAMAVPIDPVMSWASQAVAATRLLLSVDVKNCPSELTMMPLSLSQATLQVVVDCGRQMRAKTSLRQACSQWLPDHMKGFSANGNEALGRRDLDQATASPTCCRHRRCRCCCKRSVTSSDLPGYGDKGDCCARRGFLCRVRIRQIENMPDRWKRRRQSRRRLRRAGNDHGIALSGALCRFPVCKIQLATDHRSSMAPTRTLIPIRYTSRNEELRGLIQFKTFAISRSDPQGTAHSGYTR